MTAKFAPHSYATALLRAGGMAVADGMLYRWEDQHWSLVEADKACAHAYRWLVENDSDNVSAENAVKAVRSALLWLPGLPPRTEEVVIPCLNGYVRFKGRSMELERADPTMGMRHVLACEFAPEKSAPQFESLLQRVLPDASVRERVQEYVGYTLTPDCRHQRAQFWLGAGANGKGTLANIVQALHRQVAAANLGNLDGFRLWPLVGASLIVVDEASKGRVNEDLLKSLIPGETVQVDRKQLKPITTRILAKWLVLGNHVPAIVDTSDGFWRKWDFIPFDVAIPEAERNPGLAQDIIRDELAGVLNWALKGLQRLVARGSFESPEPVILRVLKERTRGERSTVQSWISENEVKASVHGSLPKARARAHYVDWCKTNGITPSAQEQFWKEVRVVPQFEEGRRRVNGKQIRFCNLTIDGESPEAVS